MAQILKNVSIMVIFPNEKILVILIKKKTKKKIYITKQKQIIPMLYLLLIHQWLHNTYQRHIDIMQTPSSKWKGLGLIMSSSPIGCSVFQWAMFQVQQFRELFAARPCPHKLSSYWSGSVPTKIIVLSQFHILFPVN